MRLRFRCPETLDTFTLPPLIGPAPDVAEVTVGCPECDGFHVYPFVVSETVMEVAA